MPVGRGLILIPGVVLVGAGTFTGDPIMLPMGVKALAFESKFVRDGGGTTTKVFMQTSLDGGATWVDIAQHAFATTTASKVSAVKTAIAVAASYTPTDATLADDSIKDGIIGDRVRGKYIVAGTYTGASSLTVSAVPN